MRGPGIVILWQVLGGAVSLEGILGYFFPLLFMLASAVVGDAPS